MRDETSERLYILLDDLNRQWSHPMNILDIFRNEFLHNLGTTEHIAVDHNGVPIARAGDRAAVEQAAPNAAAYFSGADFEPAEQPVEVPAAAPAPVAVETTPVNIPPMPALNAQPDPNLPTSPYPGAIEPADPQPPQDNDPVEPGAEPTAPAAKAPAKLN